MHTTIRKAAWLPFAALAALAQPAAAAPVSADATAEAEVDNSVLLENTEDLEFGTIALSGTGGSVTIDPGTDAASTVGDVTLYGPVRHRAVFVSRAPVGTVMLMALDPSVTLTRGGGTETMTATLVRANGPGLLGVTVFGLPIGAQATTAEQEIYVGGTLTVPAGQAEGVYSGQFNLMVSYL